MSMMLRARALGVGLSLFIVAFCLSTPSAIQAGAAAPGAASALAADYGNLPLSFERNDGQSDAQVKFFSRGSGYRVFLTSREAVLVLTQRAPSRNQTAASIHGARQDRAQNNPWAQANTRTELISTVLRLRLAGEKLNAAPEVMGLTELVGRSNYFRGNDPRHWITNIPNYQQVRYRGVYPGVDLVYYGNQRQLEYDMVVAPHSDPAAIRFEVAGAKSLEVSASGDLMLHTTHGDMMLRKPVLYQEAGSGAVATPAGNASSSTAVQRENVEGSYILHGNEIQFQVGPYDSSRPLVIDPVLSYSTFLGGSGFDRGEAIAVDGSGNAYISGSTSSPDFPTTNTINPFNQSQMVFITKLNPTGTTLLYSTYLGGTASEDSDSASGIAIDSSSPPNVYVSGTTFDTDFPVTNNGYLTSQPNPNAANVFVSKVNGAGNGLLYSTYLGGTNNSGTSESQDSGNSIAADASGNAYVTGTTTSDNFPTVNGFQPADPAGLGTFTPVPFVSKINTTLSGNASLVYSTYLGGTASNTISVANGIATNGQGKVYVTGTTNTADFPVKNAFQNALVANSQNAFVSVLDTTLAGGASLVYSTYLGGTTTGIGDTGTGIAVDGTGKIDVTGITGAPDFPVTANAFASSLATGSCTNAFVSQFDPTKTGAASLVYSTYLGGDDILSPCSEEGIGIVADLNGKIYVTGQTDSSTFPVKNPLQAMIPRTGNLGLSVFISQFDATQLTGANTLLFSTYLGGSKGSTGDRGFGIAVDSTAANIFVTGSTDSYDFPTLNPLALFGGGESDGFVTKINMAGTSPAILLTPNALTFNNRAGGTTSGFRTVIVKNAGNASLTISGISISNTVFSQTNTCGALPATLAAGATCTISVVYSPPVAGNWSATMLITSNSLGSPHQVSLRGAGANVSLTSSLNPSTYFDSVTFTATVTTTIQPGIPLGGTVEFMDGVNTVDVENVVSGTATFITSALALGTHSITAVYDGDTYRSRSNPSNVITQTVNQAATTTVVTSSLNPSAFGAGLPPTFTATVTTNNGQTTPVGTVIFKDGTTVLGSGPLDDAGQTAFTPASNMTLALGHHPITAVYQDDAIPANWAGSTSAILDQVVNQPSSSNLTSNLSGQAPLTVFFTRNPSRRLLILTMTVNGNFGTPTGNVTFSDGALALGSATLMAVNSTTATAILQVKSPLPVGLNQIVAVYPGDATYVGTTSTLAIYQSPRPRIR